MLNYFNLMAMPVQFELDQAQLQESLRQLQRQFHPDSQAASATNNVNRAAQQLLANLKAEQQSSVINEAYQALSSPDSRAKHLLALQGVEQSINEPIRDLAFLQDAMEFRMALEEANLDQLSTLTHQLKAWISSLSQQFSQTYQALLTSSTESETLTNQALDNLQKLQFLVKLARDTDKQYDSLASLPDNDDTLYV